MSKPEDHALCGLTCNASCRGTLSSRRVPIMSCRGMGCSLCLASPVVRWGVTSPAARVSMDGVVDNQEQSCIPVRETLNMNMLHVLTRTYPQGHLGFGSVSTLMGWWECTTHWEKCHRRKWLSNPETACQTIQSYGLWHQLLSKNCGKSTIMNSRYRRSPVRTFKNKGPSYRLIGIIPLEKQCLFRHTDYKEVRGLFDVVFRANSFSKEFGNKAIDPEQ